MDTLKAMRTLAQVVDSGSFAQAARDLDVAPAVVTRVVADLERDLGVRLLDRTTRRNALTDVGRRYLERARTILREVDDAGALARQAQARPCGAVRVLAPRAFAVAQIAPRLARFHGAHPHVSVHVATADAVDPAETGHDLSIVVREAALDGDFVAHRLAHSHVVACASPAYLDRHGRPTHPDELARHALLIPATPRGLTWHRRTDRLAAADAATVVPAQPPSWTGSDEMHLAAALAGAGIAALPSFAIEAALHDGRLEPVLPGWHLAALSVWASMPSRRHLPASTRALLEFLRAEFGNADGDPWAGPCAVLQVQPASLRLQRGGHDRSLQSTPMPNTARPRRRLAAPHRRPPC